MYVFGISIFFFNKINKASLDTLFIMIKLVTHQTYSGLGVGLSDDYQ